MIEARVRGILQDPQVVDLWDAICAASPLGIILSREAERIGIDDTRAAMREIRKAWGEAGGDPLWLVIGRVTAIGTTFTVVAVDPENQRPSLEIRMGRYTTEAS